MRFLRFFILIFALSGVAFAMPAYAQEKVAVRSGGHDGYSRLVMEWGAKPTYSLSKEGGRLLLRFSKAGAPDLSGFTKDDNVKSVDILSSAKEPLQVAIAIPAGSRFRDFVVENKVIVDVYDSADKPAEKPAEAKADTPAEISKKVEEPAPAKEAAKPVPVAEEKKQESSAKQDFTRKPAEAAKPAPVGEVEAAAVPPPALASHVVTLTSITSFGVSAFERNGQLFIALDNTENNIAPQIAGPQKENFGAFKKLENVTGGTVYTIELPEGLHAYGDGGGLSWRIILADKPKKQEPIIGQSVTDGDGGKLVWPLQNMRKIVSFDDPLVGDKINAVTASDALQFSGPARSYVNLQTLQSAVGLAYVPKSDDVSAKVTLADVSVETPRGLALSSSEELQPEKIRQDMNEGAPEEEVAPEEQHKEEAAKEESLENKPAEEDTKEAEAHAPAEHEEAAATPHDESLALKEEPPAVHGEGHDEASPASKEEMTKAAEEKPSGNNIYNFPRWEMGGIKTLKNNMHVLMVEAANKPTETRAEDIITMAKLLIANNRGPEALGMLRIALQKVPEISENKEFQSLRGAALAMAGKFDEAFVDLSREELNQYDDIKLWLAYVLGGLEDWRQAGQVLPPYANAIQSYPIGVRVPMSLMFAEIALRNGNLPLADSMLDILKPDIEKLALPYASSWKYLAGEAQRQHGNLDVAAEYWDPLVHDGKDDLFRAKAGLSLTKLQIDQKKLKPEGAIDRLEGLRYAWRGDELETLINYRLGQLYIDNKEYLKGLSVLRNATTLTPGLQVGRDVKDYMVKSFRDIFANDRLKTVSPLDAIGIYEEFKDLTPPGPESNAYVEKLAERLVEADLLGRAASLLEYQVNNRLQGDKKAEIAIRLAAIRLLDGNPDGALRSLEIAQDTLNKIEKGVATGPTAAATKPENLSPEAGGDSAATASEKSAVVKVDPEKQRQIYLLKARALSMKKKPDEAIAILDKMPPDADVSRLRTDIAWLAGKWEEAAMSLNDLIMSEDISGKSPLTDYQRDLILNRAIALNLSGNRVALANMRERYYAQMKGTSKGQMFEIVSRARRPDMIGSREAIESMISEIDLFKGFLEGYGKMDAAQKSGVKEPAAPKEPVPAGGGAQKPEDKAAAPAAAPAAQEKAAE